jgi:hypothetical protein
VLHRLWEAELNAQIRELIACGRTDRDHLDHIASLRRQADQHKRLANLAPASTPGAIG